MVVSLDVERSLEKCMVRMMDLTDGKFGVPLPRLETKSDNIKETEKMSSQFLEDQLKDCSV